MFFLFDTFFLIPFVLAAGFAFWVYAPDRTQLVALFQM